MRQSCELPVKTYTEQWPIVWKRYIMPAFIALLSAMLFLSISTTASWAAEEDGGSEMGSSQISQTETSEEGQGGQGGQSGPPPNSPAKKFVLWLHVFLVGLWVGGHGFLLFVMPRTILETDNYAQRVLVTYKAFSKYIMPVFAMIIVAGVSNVLVAGRPSSPPAGSPQADMMAKFFNLFLLPKISLALIAAVVGALTSFVLLPKLAKLVQGTDDAPADEAGALKVAGQVRNMSIINFVISAVIIFVAIRGLM